MVAAQELESVLIILQESPDLNVPDLKRQIMAMDQKLYTTDLANFLLDGVTERFSDFADDARVESSSLSKSVTSHMHTLCGGQRPREGSPATSCTRE